MYKYDFFFCALIFRFIFCSSLHSFCLGRGDGSAIIIITSFQTEYKSSTFHALTMAEYDAYVRQITMAKINSVKCRQQQQRRRRIQTHIQQIEIDNKQFFFCSFVVVVDSSLSLSFLFVSLFLSLFFSEWIKSENILFMANGVMITGVLSIGPKK